MQFGFLTLMEEVDMTDVPAGSHFAGSLGLTFHPRAQEHVKDT